MKWEDHREIGALSATGAHLMENYNKAWDDVAKNADPADPNALTAAAKQFREETLEPALAKWQEGASTENAQRFAQSFADRFREHMFQRTAADIANHASDFVHTSIQETANANNNSLYRDASNLPLIFDNSDKSLSHLVQSSGVTAEQASKITNEIGFKTKQSYVNSAIEGAIAKGAPYQQIIDDPKYKPYVNLQEIERYAREEKRQQREDQIQTRQMQLLQKQQAESDFHTAISKAHADNESFDPATGKVIIGPRTIPQLQAARKAAADSGIDTSAVDTHISWVEAQQRERKEPVVSDPAVTADLDTRMFSANNPTTDVDIRKAEVAGKLNRYDASTRLNLLKALEDKPLTGPIFRDTIESVKGVLGSDPKGHEAFGKFVQQFIPEYQRMSRAGTLPPNALDVRDPDSMISQAMKPYRRDPMQMLMDRASHGLLTPQEFVPPPAQSRALAPPIKVATPQDAAKLNPGTRYITPDGKIYVR